MIDVLPEKVANLFRHAIKNTIETKRPTTIEYSLTMQGCERYYEVRNLFFSEDQVAIFVKEITSRKETEKLLKQSEEKYHELFNNAPVAIILFSNEGIILDCNELTSKLMGYTKKELLQRNVSDFNFLPDDQRDKLEKIDELIEKDLVPLEQEMKLKRKDDTIFWASVQVTLINLGNIKYIQTILQDVTEKKNAKQELINLNKIKSDFLRRASHELKTPLISIKGFTDLMVELYGGVFTTEMFNNINEIKQGCGRLENLIHIILKASELQSENVSIKKSPENLSFLIKYCLNELNGLLKLRDMSIKLDLPEKLITSFEKEQIFDVLTNILTNAIKFSPPHSMLEIGSQLTNDKIIISIKDNGIGFTEEEKMRIFKKFGKIERYGQGLDLKSDGSGLGLYISKKIIKLHGGNIWMESEGRNKGSTFYFSLPLP